MTIKEAYDKGFRDGIYSQWKHVELINDLERDLENFEMVDGYDPPKDDDGPGEDSNYVSGQGFISN